MDEALKDERFNHILTDPRFRKMPRNIQKIKVDKRFKDMFKNRTFKEKCSIDKRGRQLNLTSSENLKKLYDITSESSSEEEESSSNKPKKQVVNKKISNHSETNINENETVSKLHDAIDKSEDSESDKKNVSKLKKRNKDKTLNKSHCKSIESFEHSGAFDNDERFQLHALNNADIDDSCIQSSCNSSTEKKDTSLNLQKHIENNDARESSEDSSDADSESDDDDASKKGESESSEDSSDDDSESDDADEGPDFDHHWDELNENAPVAEQITKRLAVCNMDWDRIRAVDLMVVLNSFKPTDGYISSVKIYPSEYGLKRLEEERLHGPPELVEEVLASDEEEDSEDVARQVYNREKLRQYQMNRLKYYYAVVETDSPETANYVYEQVNGMEYESCAVRMDLRFIPDDVTFDQEPTSVVDKVPDLTGFEPMRFTTTALQQVHVNLTWDETDPRRKLTLEKAFNKPENIESDLKDYLASSSGESENETENIENNEKLSTGDRIAKYKALLQSLEEKEKNEEEKYEMEVTWDPELKEKTEEIVKEKLENDYLNPFEEFLKKRREKRKLKKKGKNITDEASDESSDEGNLSLSGGKNKKHDSTDEKALAELALMSDAKKIDLSSSKKKKRNKYKIKKENLDDFKCDVNDSRFSAIYSSHLYNIDPSDPHFKSTPGNIALLHEKQKKFKHARTDFEIRNAKKAKHN